MNTPKEKIRDAEVEAKKAAREVDGHDLGDDIANAGDEIRKDLANTGDRLRETADRAGDDLHDAGRDTPR